jgi:hypothetical protein
MPLTSHTGHPKQVIVEQISRNPSSSSSRRS